MMNLADKEGSSLPAKRPRMTCLIHCSDEDSDHMVSPQNLESWKTLLRAAEIREHGPVLELAKDLPDGEMPEIQYHRKCRIIFTMKRLLEECIAKKAACVEPTEQGSRRSSRDAPSSSTSRVFNKRCIFCEKSSKYLKGQKTRETLIQCSELRSDDRIRIAAARKLDNRMLAITSRELVAAEGHYHRSCYRAYTREEPADTSAASEQGDDIDSQYKSAEKRSYDELFLYIRNELIPKPEILRMTDLTSRLVSSMNSFGIKDVTDSTRKHLRRKLETEFSDSIHILEHPEETTEPGTSQPSSSEG